MGDLRSNVRSNRRSNTPATKTHLSTRWRTKALVNDLRSARWRTSSVAQKRCGGAGGNRTPVPQPVSEIATTIPGIASDAETPTGRLPDQARPRSVFPESQQSFPLAMVFPIVIPHFCCRAVVEWPRATFLLTMTLHSSDRNQAARANCSSAILWFPRFTSLRNSGRKLEQRY